MFCYWMIWDGVWVQSILAYYTTLCLVRIVVWEIAILNSDALCSYVAEFKIAY